MTQIDAYTAEARAATILHGLGFTEGQIHGTTGSLSGGWRMRVAIAGALFIQPEV
jgi:ATPase subunit of ABC transporter with duplicated ATPase domains